MSTVPNDGFPKPLPLMDCPAWCTHDHTGEHPNEVEDLSDHWHDLLEERDEQGRLALWIAITATDSLGERTRTPAGIHIYSDEPLSPDRAVRMVGAVSEGLRILAA